MIREPRKEFKSTPLKKGRKKKDGEDSKGLGLFDHLKHIRFVKDPDYYKNLSDIDKKSFNPFSILKGLSMNPNNISTVSYIYRYFDRIPLGAFYKLLIGSIPFENSGNFYPWIKSKKSPVPEKVVELFSIYFQISKKEAKEYGLLLLKRPDGDKVFVEICQDYGMTEKEIKEALKGMEDEQ